MPNNTLSLGHDVTIDIFDIASGKHIIFPNGTGFHAQPKYKTVTSTPLNGDPLQADNPDGWHGSLEFDRVDNSIDVWFADREARYWRNQSLFNVSFIQTIQEADGSVSQMRFPNASMKLSDPGSWKSSEKVTIKVDWEASTRERIV